MNTVPVVDGKNIMLFSNGIRRTTIYDTKEIVGTPTVANGIVTVPTKTSSGRVICNQYDEKTGLLKRTLY